MTWTPELTGTVLAAIVLMAVATAVLSVFRAQAPWAPAFAVLRGGIQLAILSVILAGVISDVRWVALALLVMFAAAVYTVSRRLGASPMRVASIAGAMALGIGVALGVVFAFGAIAFSPRYVLAVGGIVIGGTMTIATLSGRAFSTSVNDHWDEVEGWLALGATRRESTRDRAREAVHFALIPVTDQTKTTGLVVLPGAFVGAIFGGASPLEAGRFQIVVLVSLITAGSLAAVTLLSLLGPVRTRPVDVRLPHRKVNERTDPGHQAVDRKREQRSRAEVPVEETDREQRADE